MLKTWYSTGSDAILSRKSCILQSIWSYFNISILQSQTTQISLAQALHKGSFAHKVTNWCKRATLHRRHLWRTNVWNCGFQFDSIQFNVMGCRRSAFSCSGVFGGGSMWSIAGNCKKSSICDSTLVDPCKWDQMIGIQCFRDFHY